MCLHTSVRALTLLFVRVVCLEKSQLEIAKQTHPEHLVIKEQGIIKVQRSAEEAVTTIQTPNDKKVEKAHLGEKLPALQLEIDQLKQKLALSVKECDLARQDKDACVRKSKNLEKELRSWLHELEQVCTDSKESEKRIRKQQVYIQELKAELNALRQNMDLMAQDKESLVISIKLASNA